MPDPILVSARSLQERIQRDFQAIQVLEYIRAEIYVDFLKFQKRFTYPNINVG